MTVGRIRYTPSIADAICERIAAGEAVNAIGGSKGMPAERTISDWLEDRADFAQSYARARQRQADKYAGEVVSIADAASADTIRGIELARTRIDARKWAAAKLAPKKYGDRTTIAGDPSAPLTIQSMVAEAKETVRVKLARLAELDRDRS